MKIQKYAAVITLVTLLVLSTMLTSGFMRQEIVKESTEFSNVVLSSDSPTGNGVYPTVITDTVLSVGGIMLDAGDTGNVLLAIADVTNLGSFEMTVSWDPSVVNITDVDGLGDFIVNSYFDHVAGYVNIVGYISVGATGSFDIAEIAVEAVGDPGDSCDLLLSASDLMTADPTPLEIDHIANDGFAEIRSHPALSVTKIVKETEEGTPYNYLLAEPNDVVYYTIIVENTGDVRLDISIIDEIHEYLTVLTDVEETYVDGNTYYWNISNLDPEETVTIEFPVKISADACGLIENTVIVNGFDDDEIVATDTDSADIDVQCEMITLSKTVKENCCGDYADSITVDYGQYVTYKVEVYTGMSLWSLSVRDTLPNLTGLLYNNSYVMDGSGNYIHPSEYNFEMTKEYLYWNFSLIDPGTYLAIYYCADTLGCGPYTNEVNITALKDPCCDEWIYLEDSAVVDIICPSGVCIQKEVSLDGITWLDESVETFVGDTVWFKLKVTNLGFDPVYGISVLDYLPDFVEFDTVVSDGDADIFEDHDGWLRWFYQKIDDGVVIVFKATVVDIGVDVNLACVSGCDEGEWCDSVLIEVFEGMHVEKRVSLDNETWMENVSASGGDDVWWNVTVSYYSSHETLTLYRLVFEDLLPENVSYIPGTGIIIKNDGFRLMMDPEVNNNTLTWNLTDVTGCVLTNGSWLSIIFKTSIDVDAIGELMNWVNVSGWQCDDTMVFDRDNALVYIAPSENHAPKAFNPVPFDGATNVSVDAILKITVSDSDNDTLTVKFYDASDDSLIKSFTNVIPTNTLTTAWNDLEYNTTYHWYVTVYDGNVTITSSNWSFTTEQRPDNSPPNEPVNPNPSNNAVNIVTNPVISVYVSDPDDNSLTVKFYDDSNDRLIGTDTCSNDCTASVTWSGLSYQTTYRWYVVVSDGEFEVTSDTWSFTTEALDIDLNLNIEGGFGITLDIENAGSDAAYDVSWSIHVANQGFLNRIDKTESGTVAMISAGSVVYQDMKVFGIGKVEITATASCDGATPVTKVQDALVIGSFVIL